MKSMRLKAALLAACVVLALLTTPAQAKDKWINLSTKNFNIISNADEGGTRRLALKLEQFHFVFSKLFNLPLERAVPTTVMVFKHDGSFRPFKPLYNGKPANLAGYFQGGQDENIIAVDISANQEHPMALIYHEHTHLLTSDTPREWPVWLKEGLAELYSSFDVDANKVTLGAPISRHVMLLRDKTFIPLQDLLSVRHGSPIYNARDKQGMFYAESWALSHYLIDSTVETSATGETSPPRLVRRPSLKREGTQTIRGVLVSIECKAGKWTLVVNTKDDLVRFAVSDKDKLEFYSQDPQFEGQVNCGSVNKIAFIYFKPMPGSKFAGDAVAVEFTKD